MRLRRGMHRRQERKNIENSGEDKTSWFMRIGFLVSLGILLLGNIFLFASSVKLTDSITQLETETQKIRKDNERLNQKLYAENSLQTLEYIAEQSGFTKQAEPFYLGKTDYAMAR